MNSSLPSQKRAMFRDLLDTRIVRVRRNLFLSDFDLDDFEQKADGTFEFLFSNHKVICFVAITEVNSVGVVEGCLPIPGSSYITLDLSHNNFWRERIEQNIEKIEILKSPYASQSNPSEFAVEFQLENDRYFCIEYLNEEEFPDTIRAIEKYEGE